MEKGVDPEMKHGDGDVTLLGDEEKDVANAVTKEEIDWKNKDGACAALAKLRPEMGKWECELIWRVIGDARKDPEEMDITKLYASATSIAKDVTKNDLVAAGANKETMFALVLKKMVRKNGHRGSKRIEAGDGERARRTGCHH
jgi:hypothetical protein